MSRNIAHERRCAVEIRQRRKREGKPPAAYVMAAYWDKRRVARYAALKAGA